MCVLFLIITWISHEERQQLYFFSSELLFFHISSKHIYEIQAQEEFTGI